MSDPTHNPNSPLDPSVTPGPMVPPQQNPQGPYSAPQYGAPPQYGQETAGQPTPLQSAPTYSQSPAYDAAPQYASPQHSSPQHSSPQHSSPQYPSPQYPNPQQPNPQYPAAQYPNPQQPGGYGPGSFGPPPGPPMSAPKKSPALWIALGVVLLLLAGGGAFLMLRDSGDEAGEARKAAAKYSLSDLTVPTHFGMFYSFMVQYAEPKPIPEVSTTGTTIVGYAYPGDISSTSTVIFEATESTNTDLYFSTPPKEYGDLLCGDDLGSGAFLCLYQLKDGRVTIDVDKIAGQKYNPAIPSTVEGVAELAQTYITYATEGEPEIVAPDLSALTTSSTALPKELGSWYLEGEPTMTTPSGATAHRGYFADSDIVYDAIISPEFDAAAMIASLENASVIYGINCGTVPTTTQTACVLPMADGALVTTDGTSALGRPDWQSMFTFTLAWLLLNPDY